MIFFGGCIKTHIFAAINKKPETTMKKMLSIVAVASLALATVACGPSKAELEAKEKAKQDSLAEVAKADSIAQAAMAAAEQAKADSAKAVEEAKMKMVADSLHADSVKKHLIKEKKK